MNQELLSQLQTAQQALMPQLKTLQQATAALNTAIKLAGSETTEALAMQKALQKLQQATAGLDDETVQLATRGFEQETQQALDALAFEFARDLRATFERRGQTVEGRPPTLTVGLLTLQMDIGARRAQWFYGKEPLTRPLPLSTSAIVKAYDQQRKRIADRAIDVAAFVEELYKVWNREIESRPRRPAGNRLNLVETYASVVMNRQSARFRNAPSRATFTDYERPLFARDLVLAQGAPSVTADGKRYRLRLGVATKSQADSASRSLWLPNGDSALDGQYYSDIAFEEG